MFSFWQIKFEMFLGYPSWNIQIWSWEVWVWNTNLEFGIDDHRFDISVCVSEWDHWKSRHRRRRRMRHYPNHGILKLRYQAEKNDQYIYILRRTSDEKETRRLQYRVSKTRKVFQEQNVSCVKCWRVKCNKDSKLSMWDVEHSSQKNTYDLENWI